jgi:hypothetical protein
MHSGLARTRIGRARANESNGKENERKKGMKKE